MNFLIKTCIICGYEKHISEFGKRYSKCKTCYNIYARKNIAQNSDKYLRKLLKSAKRSSKNRTEMGRKIAGTFEITFQDIKDLLIKQNGKCYYSNIQLSLNQSSDWQCSLERLNPDYGYIKSNVALIALEFQSCSQWSIEKFNEFINLLNCKFDDRVINWKPIKKLSPSKQKVTKYFIDNKEYCKCNKCNTIKTLDNFRKDFKQCKQCKSAYNKEYYESPVGHFRKLAHNMKTSCKKRNHPNPEVTYQSLIDIFEKQSGLCYYTKIPMQFGSYTDKNWTCSVERKDCSIGYTINNTCLICHELNTSIKSAKNEDYNLGNSGWNIEKVFYLLKINSE